MELQKAVDNLCLFDPEFQASADKFLTEMGGNSAAEPISTMKDLQEAIHKYSNVKFLEILLHGRPGMIDFANKGTMVGSYLGTMMQGTLFLAKNARVLFDSCNIAEGDYGDKFMADLAKKMLIGRGGIIGATTVENQIYFPRSSFVTGAYMAPLSFGRLKVRSYDESGDQIGERVVDRHGIRR